MSAKDAAVEAAKGTPALLGTAYYLKDPQFWVMVATGIYIVLQIAYLARKWWREEHEFKAKA